MSSQTEKERGRGGIRGHEFTTFRPNLVRSEKSGKTVFGAIPSQVLTNRKIFIDVARKGIPGWWVKSVVDATELRETFLTVLDVSSENLSRVYRKKALGKKTSEEILDTVRVIRQAVDVWESQELAMQWLSNSVAALDDERPTNLFDTFEGRRWVAQVLRTIEHGGFS